MKKLNSSAFSSRFRVHLMMCIFALVAASTTTFAQTETQGFDAVRAVDRTPRAGTPLVTNKLHPREGRWELGLGYAGTMSDAFVRHMGANLSLTYHISDWIGIQAFANAFYPQELKMARQARVEENSIRDDRFVPNLSNLWQNYASGGLLFSWAPLYGKLSLVSELDLSYQFYFVGGFQVDAIARQIETTGVDIGSDMSFYAGSGVNFEQRIRPSLTGGFGIRFMPSQTIGITTEVRVSGGPNDLSNVEGNGSQWAAQPLFIAGLTFLL